MTTITTFSLMPDLVLSPIAILVGAAIVLVVLTARSVIKRALHEPAGLKAQRHGASNGLRSKHGEQQPDFTEYKQIYHQLHNLELYPGVLPKAKNLLVTYLSDAIQAARQKELLEPGLLAVAQYSKDKLSTFVQGQAEKNDERWTEYLQRRKSGSSTELFDNREEAIQWLRHRAPLKLVDGAWLGYANSATTPFAYRHASKAAWQVLSEEYGDGDLQKHHVYLYNNLLREVGVHLPNAHDADFLDPRHGLDDPSAWNEAIIQLLISLFPHDFFPEILGFNLHYEAISLETMVASKELREVGIDPYYFTIHITIDNADSGHAAIAAHAVDDYLEQVRIVEGDAAADTAWRRIQAGYLLSENAASLSCQAFGGVAPWLSSPDEDMEEQVIRMFESKARVSRLVHCTSRMRVGGRPLVDWMSPESFVSRHGRKRLLQELSTCQPWIRRGDSQGSLFLKEISWGGRMFGSFTMYEVETVRGWIDSLPKLDSKAYLSFTGRRDLPVGEADASQDPLLLTLYRRSNPVHQFRPLDSVASDDVAAERSLTLRLEEGVQMKDPSKFVSLWFAHPCLLERFVSVPSRTADELGCAMVRVLRAQNGFPPESPLGVGGIDEARRSVSMGLVELGVQIARHVGGVEEEPRSLDDAIQLFPSQFALRMSAASMRPIQHPGLLVGMAVAFMQLHEHLARRLFPSASLAKLLGQIASREKEHLQAWVVALEKHEATRHEMRCGFDLAEKEIKSCFYPE